MKKIMRFLAVFLVAVLCFSFFEGFAHPGRTDSRGGHYDRSTGKYHYHHGYPAHSHPGGKCPYNNADLTSDNDSHKSNKSNKSVNVGAIVVVSFIFGGPLVLGLGSLLVDRVKTKVFYANLPRKMKASKNNREQLCSLLNTAVTKHSLSFTQAVNLLKENHPKPICFLIDLKRNTLCCDSTENLNFLNIINRLYVTQAHWDFTISRAKKYLNSINEFVECLLETKIEKNIDDVQFGLDHFGKIFVFAKGFDEERGRLLGAILIIDMVYALQEKKSNDFVFCEDFILCHFFGESLYKDYQTQFNDYSHYADWRVFEKNVKSTIAQFEAHLYLFKNLSSRKMIAFDIIGEVISYTENYFKEKGYSIDFAERLHLKRIIDRNEFAYTKSKDFTF